LLSLTRDAPPPAAISTPQAAPGEGGILSSSQVVYIIDDDTDVLEALTFLLTAAGVAMQVHESAVAFLNARRGRKRAAS
jgi:hypothetical protein